MRRLALALLPFLLFAPTSWAQEDNAALNAKIDRLERDINFMQTGLPHQQFRRR